ncbi:Uncharacterized protein DBV15_02000 [Temnothorax longispinosus]|uniref:Uncharacterized protein n=1 Tax=Temnothorax longispinosus TaxID=300112 RepID=A0A4S2KNX7_9HYME|nr:Uncharacterized protein DBV15_02000 [Temnothorax longispinosus]
MISSAIVANIAATTDCQVLYAYAPSHEIIDLTKANMNHSGLQPRKAFRSSFTLERYITRFLAAFYYPLLLLVTVGDAQLNHDITETITSNVFDSKALIDYRLMFAACAVELGLLNDKFEGSGYEKSLKAMECGLPFTVCVADAQLNHNIKDTIISKVFDIKELIDFNLVFAECAVELGLLNRQRGWNIVGQKCDLPSKSHDKLEGSWYEKSLKAMEVGLPMTVGDALLTNIIETITSNVQRFTFDLKELIDFHLIFAECAMKFDLLKIPKPELSYCIAQKKNLTISSKEAGMKNP